MCMFTEPLFNEGAVNPIICKLVCSIKLEKSNLNNFHLSQAVFKHKYYPEKCD